MCVCVWISDLIFVSGLWSALPVGLWIISVCGGGPHVPLDTIREIMNICCKGTIVRGGDWVNEGGVTRSIIIWLVALLTCRWTLDFQGCFHWNLVTQDTVKLSLALCFLFFCVLHRPTFCSALLTPHLSVKSVFYSVTWSANAAEG